MIDDGIQRLKENPPEPELTPEQIQEIAQEHEDFLNRLESLAIVALASGDWSEVYDHINFNAPEAEN